MTLPEFYKYMEIHTDKTKKELSNMTISELQILIREQFNKTLIITLL